MKPEMLRIRCLSSKRSSDFRLNLLMKSDDALNRYPASSRSRTANKEFPLLEHNRKRQGGHIHTVTDHLYAGIPVISCPRIKV